MKLLISLRHISQTYLFLLYPEWPIFNILRDFLFLLFDFNICKCIGRCLCKHLNLQRKWPINSLVLPCIPNLLCSKADHGFIFVNRMNKLVYVTSRCFTGRKVLRNGGNHQRSSEGSPGELGFHLYATWERSKWADQNIPCAEISGLHGYSRQLLIQTTDQMWIFIAFERWQWLWELNI